MVDILLKRMLSVFIFFLLLMVILLASAQQMSQRDFIRQFFLSSFNCEQAPCFLGVVPDVTEQHAVYDALDAAPIVEGYSLRQVEFGLGQMDLFWNGQQPSFLSADGFLTLVGQRAETIELDPDLVLGDMLVVLGEPTHVLLSTYNVYLYYFEQGLIIESDINCHAIYYSPVRIIYRERPQQLSSLATGNATIHDVC